MNTLSTNFSNSEDNLTGLPTYRAGVAQSSAYRILMKFTDNAVKEYGITAMQWFMIGSIYDAGGAGVTVTQLSKLLDTNVPYITNTLNLLASKDIIIRTSQEGDTRQKTVTINDDFRNHVQEIENSLRKKMQSVLYADISSQELLTYIKVLYKINASSLESTGSK